MSYILTYDDVDYKLSISDIIKLIKSNPDKLYYKTINNIKILINNNIVCNTLFICHRINTINDLSNIDDIFGIEFDVRDHDNNLILSHDPYNNGDNLDDYLKNYNHKTAIFNIKSERTELKCLELIKKYNIIDYFFLDSSFPMIYLLNKYNCSNIASRYSEYECLDFTKNISNLIKWIWIDCFTILPLNNKIYYEIKKLNKKICIVSPELQNQKEKISQYRQQLIDNNIIPDAICCKIYNIYEWI